MTVSEYKAVMDELGIPRLKPKNGQKLSLKDRIKIRVDDYRFSDKYEIGFFYNFFPCCSGKIPTEVIKNTYRRLGKECFGRGDRFETLKRKDLSGKYITSFRIGDLRDFLVFYDCLVRYYSDEEEYDEEVKSIDVNEVYARVMSKLFESRKSSLSKTPREFMNKKFKSFSERNLGSKLDNDNENVANLLDEFDKAVNPVLDDSFEFGNIHDFAKRNDISVCFDSLSIGQYDRDYTSYKYGSQSLSFESNLLTKISKVDRRALETMRIVHRVSKPIKLRVDSSKRVIKPHETLEITKYDKNNRIVSLDEYDLTNNSVGLVDKHDITLEDLQKISFDLKVALSIINERNKKLGSKTLKLEKNGQTK